MHVLIFHSALAVLTFAAIAALGLRGGRPERFAAAAILVVTLAPIGLQQFEASNVRWLLALISVLFSASLIALALSNRRWWLIGAAGIQAAATVSYAVAWSMPDLLMWSAVAFRQVLWVQLMIVSLLGAWEPSDDPFSNGRGDLEQA